MSSESTENEKKAGTGCRPFLPLFISHCFTPLLILIIFIIALVLFNTLNYEGPFTSQNGQLDTNNVPNYFIQLSDLHFHHLFTDEVQTKRTYLRELVENFEPQIVVLTGDIVDSSDSLNSVKYHRNFQENWDAFDAAFRDSGFWDIPGLRLLPVAGNHDEFAVAEDTPEKHPFRRYFLNDDDEFYLRSVVIENTNGNKPFNFVLFNPVYPPAPTGPLAMAPFITKENIERLKGMLLEDHFNVLVTHYPIIFLWSDADSTGRSIREACGQYDLMVTGHLHPRSPESYRMNGKLSIISSTNRRSGTPTIYTIDNNMSNFHIINTSIKHPLLITYPLNELAITSETIFNLHDFEVRVLYLSDDQNADITFSIDENDYGSLGFKQQVRDGVLLFTSDVSNIADGFHTLHVHANPSGENDEETDYTMEFFVGNEYPQRQWSYNWFALLFPARLQVGIACFVTAYATLRIIPFWLIPAVKSILETYDNYLYHSDEVSLAGWQIFLYSILDFITRFRKCGTITYFTLIFDTLWPLFIPLYVTPIDGKFGAIFGYGMVVDGHISIFVAHFLVWWIYTLVFVFPLGGFSSFVREKKPFYFECVIYAIELIGILITWFIIGNFVGEEIGIFASPLTYIIIISYVLVIIDLVFFFKRTKCKVEGQDEGNSENKEEKSDSSIIP